MPHLMAVIIWPFCTGLPQQDSSIRNAIPPRQILFKTSIYHDQRDTSHSYYGPKHWRLFSRSQSCYHSHLDRSSSFGRHTLCSSSSHCSTLHHPSADCPFHHPLCCDINRHSCSPFHTHHFSHRCHSCHSMDWSWSCSNSPTAQHRNLIPERPNSTKDPHKPHCSKNVTIQDSPSYSSSDLDSDPDPLNY